MSVNSSLNGRRLLLRDARELAENLQGLSRAEQRRLDTWVTRYEQEVSERQAGAYADAAERNVALAETLVNDLTGLSSLADSIAKEVRSGRKPAAEGRRQLTAVFRGIHQIRDQIGTLQESDERAWSEVKRDPAEVQQEIISKYGLQYTLPVFNEDVLAG